MPGHDSDAPTTLTPLLGGRYRYLHELGRGAIGRVIAVEDTLSGAARAAKIAAAEDGERLRWELAALESVAHPNLASVHELLRLEAPLEAPLSIDTGAW